MATNNGGRRNPQKGKRVERGLVNSLRELGLNAERVPLSGSCGGAFAGDIVVRLHRELRTEVKSRKGGKGFAQLEKWLGKNDLLILKRDRQAPMVLIPWSVFTELGVAACEAPWCEKTSVGGAMEGVPDGSCGSAIPTEAREKTSKANRGVWVDEEGNELEDG